MFATKRVRIVAVALAVALVSGGIAAGVATSASASPTSAQVSNSAKPQLSADRFDMSGYVIDAKYTLGRNTGNTFEQTYTHSMVQGVPIAGPFTGTVFPPVDYVALSIGHHEVYIAWQDPESHAIVDAFVMDFVNHIVYDYAPGSANPESVGTITVVKTGPNRIP